MQYGRTPLDFAKQKEIRELLKKAEEQSNNTQPESHDLRKGIMCTKLVVTLLYLLMNTPVNFFYW